MSEKAHSLPLKTVDDTPWWKTAVIYQIYPRSFCDTDGDGVGDLEGVRQRLDYLQWLGVDALWLSPFFTSPMKDFGYDVADFCNVDPLFGSLSDFDALLSDLHQRGMRLLIDWVPNHTSDQHPWFVESRSGRDNPKRDWYVWRDGSPDAPPNNWKAAFDPSAPAWTWDTLSNQWYLHCFLAEQPDLNWDNLQVVAAMHDTLRFWLNRGVDGFRMDVIHLIGKDPALPDLPTGAAAILSNDQPRTHELLRGIRGILDEYDGDRTSVGEVFLLDTAKVVTYYGNGDELHLAFNFPPLLAPWDAVTWRGCIEQVEQEYFPRDAWPSWVLSNHDVPRHRTRYGSEARARAAAVLLLTLRGTPFLYAGEELGLENAVVPADRQVDPGGRDGCRSPIPWNDQPQHGWATCDAWLPWPPHAETLAASVQQEDPASMANLYRRLLRARRSSPALTAGTLTLLPAPNGVLIWRRQCGSDTRIVAVNFTEEPVDVPHEGLVLISSVGGAEGRPFGGSIGPDQAVVLQG